MLVSELITKLQELPDKHVLVRGYEAGYNGLDPEDIHIRTLVKCDGPWYYGMFHELDVKPSSCKVITEPKEYLCLE